MEDNPPGVDSGRRRLATGVLLPQGHCPCGMRPPLSSSQSPLSSVSACGENCARSLAPPLPTARGAVGAPHKDIKKRMRRARWKRKNVRRVGLRQRRPPAAGGGRLAVPCGSQGRKRPALGETFGPGKFGIPAAPLFAAAGRLLMKALARGKATASASAGQRVAKRNARKEKLVKCVLAPRRGRHHPPRDGSSKSCGRV